MRFLTERDRVKKSNAQILWGEACNHLKGILHPDIYERWIAVIEADDLADNLLTLAVDNDYYQTWLEDNYVPLIQSAIDCVNGGEVRVTFRVRPKSAFQEEAPTTRPKKSSIKKRFRKRSRAVSPLNPKFTFDTFIVGPSNNFAHAASQAVAQPPARAYNPLFIYGDVGLGKTHLMQAIGHYMEAQSQAAVTYVSSEAFVNEYIDALQNRGLVEFRKRYRSTDILLIDDIQFLAKKERLQEEFFHTFNALFDAHKQIVMTSDRPAAEITDLEQRLVSRFEWGLVAELESPDLETRIAILRNKQAEANVKLPDEIILFIAENIRANIRRLEGALIRVISYSSLMRKELTLESVKNLLRDTLDQEQQEELSFGTIQRAVAEHFDVRVADMTSKRRPRSVAVPRQVAMFLCRRMTASSLPEIANAFNKTHATVLHAYRTVENRMDVDSDLKRDVMHISHKLGRSL